MRSNVVLPGVLLVFVLFGLLMLDVARDKPYSNDGNDNNDEVIYWTFVGEAAPAWINPGDNIEPFLDFKQLRLVNEYDDRAQVWSNSTNTFILILGDQVEVWDWSKDELPTEIDIQNILLGNYTTHKVTINNVTITCYDAIYIGNISRTPRSQAG